MYRYFPSLWRAARTITVATPAPEHLVAIPSRKSTASVIPSSIIHHIIGSSHHIITVQSKTPFPPISRVLPPAVERLTTANLNPPPPYSLLISFFRTHVRTIGLRYTLTSFLPVHPSQGSAFSSPFPSSPLHQHFYPIHTASNKVLSRTY